MILGTICARGGSKGIPRKNLIEIKHRPLLQYTLDHASQCAVLDKIVISTEDEEIANKFRHTGNVQMRPPELATDTASKWDVFRYIAECNPQYNILVDLDTGCPLRSPVDIIECLKKLWTGFDVVATAYACERNPYFNMVRMSPNGSVHVVNDMDVCNRQSAPVVYSLSPSVFAIRREALFKFSHWSRSNMGIVEIPRKRAIDIDTPEDLEYVEYLMRQQC